MTVTIAEDRQVVNALSAAGGHMRTESLRAALIALSLCVIVFTLYARTQSHSFLTWDDPAYVTDNPSVRSGITVAGVEWAFRSTLHGNWHPMTVLSHMLDVQIFGISPGPHHLVSVGWHAANAALLFLSLLQLTRAAVPSAFAAALFAVHPLNVETVAWIAERKSLLSLFFGLLAISAYVSWTKRPSAVRYALFITSFALSLMSKAMLVTLPLLLLVIDVWPLERASSLRDIINRIPEKLPAFALSLICGVTTLIAQRAAGAVSTAVEVPFLSRAETALVSFAWYPLRAIWPADLNCLYLHPGLAGRAVPLLAVAASVGFVAFLTGAFALSSRRDSAGRMACPSVVFGVLWYAVAVLPVLGLVQVGFQARADRYAYVPLIGLFVGVAFLPMPKRRVLITVLSAAMIAFSFVTWRLVDTWKTDETLYSRAVHIDPDNWVMINNLSAMYLDRGDSNAAISAGRRAIDLHPTHAPAWANVGVALVRRGNYAESIGVLRRALELDASNEGAWRNLAAAYAQLDQFSECLAASRNALALDGNDPFALYWLAVADNALGNRLEAQFAVRRIREIAPAIAHDLGVAP